MDVHGFERELAAWRKKFAQQSLAPALEEELHAAESELEIVRHQSGVSGERVHRHLLRLRALWEMLYEDESRTTPA
jgi:hypothetical protein